MTEKKFAKFIAMYLLTFGVLCVYPILVLIIFQ